MKTFLSVLSVAIVLLSCQKTIDPTEPLPTDKCRVIKMEYELDSLVAYTRYFVYDSLKRIKSFEEDETGETLHAFYEGNTARLLSTMHSRLGAVDFTYNVSNQ